MFTTRQATTQSRRRAGDARDTSARDAAAKTRRRPAAGGLGPLRLASVIACSLCVAACLMPARQVECGRLQDFLQNLVGGGNHNSNSNNNSGGSSSSSSNSNSNKDANSNSNSNGDSGDSDTAASNDSNEQPMTPMMSAMNPFMRYPSFYDSFGPAAFGAGGFPGMSAFSGPMTGAMSALSPMAAMSSQSLGGAFSPSAFAPASFGSLGSFGSSSGSGNPLSAFTHAAGGAGGMSASTLNNVYSQSTPGTAFMGAYSPYYGRR